MPFFHTILRFTRSISNTQRRPSKNLALVEKSSVRFCTDFLQDRGSRRRQVGRNLGRNPTSLEVFRINQRPKSVTEGKISSPVFHLEPSPYWDRRQRGWRSKHNSSNRTKCLGALERARRADHSTYGGFPSIVSGSKVMRYAVLGGARTLEHVEGTTTNAHDGHGGMLVASY